MIDDVDSDNLQIFSNHIVGEYLLNIINIQTCNNIKIENNYVVGNSADYGQNTSSIFIQQVLFGKISRNTIYFCRTGILLNNYSGANNIISIISNKIFRQYVRTLMLRSGVTLVL